MNLNLTEWWASQTPEKQREIDRRAPRLDPNRDIGHGRPVRTPARPGHTTRPDQHPPRR